MIQPYSRLKVVDNTGAKEIRCITVLTNSKKVGQIGNQITATVKKAVSGGQVKKKEVVKAVIIRQKQNYRRPDGSYIRFDDNAAIILTKGKEPKGSRILGPVARELKEKGYKKIASQASELV